MSLPKPLTREEVTHLKSSFDEGQRLQREADAALIEAAVTEIRAVVSRYLAAGYTATEAGTIAYAICSDLAAKIREGA